MNTALGTEPMGRKKADPPEPQTVSVRVHSDLRDKLRIICAHSREVFGRFLNAPDYLDSLIRAAIERDYARTIKHVKAKD